VFLNEWKTIFYNYYENLVNQLCSKVMLVLYLIHALSLCEYYYLYEDELAPYKVAGVMVYQKDEFLFMCEPSMNKL
jgi:hypothetical protein